MSPAFLLSALRQYALLVAGCLLAGCLAGGAVGALLPPSYEATAQLVVTVGPAADGAAAPDPSAGGQYLQQQLPTFVEFAGSDAVIDGARQRLGLSVSTQELARHLSFSVPPDTLVLSITASWGDPGGAASLANAVAQSFAGYLPEQGGADSGQPSVVVKVFEPATPPDPGSMPSPIPVGIGLILGLTAGVVLALILKLRDPYARSLAGIADATGAGVLAVLPGNAPNRPRGQQAMSRLAGASGTAVSLSGAGLYARLGLGDSATRPRIVTVASLGYGVDSAAVVWALARTAGSSGVRVVIAAGDNEIHRYFSAQRGAGPARASRGPIMVPNPLSPPGNGVISTSALTVALSGIAGTADLVLIAVQNIGSNPSVFSYLGIGEASVLVVPPRPRAAALRDAAEILAASRARFAGTVVTTGNHVVRRGSRRPAESRDLEGALR